MKFKKTILFLIGILTAISCSKDDNTDDSRQLLIGKWRPSGSILSQTGEHYTPNYCEAQTIWEYFDNGELIRNNSYGEIPCNTHIGTSTFEKNENVILITSGEVNYKVKIFTLNNTTLKYEMFYSSQFGTVDESDRTTEIFTRVN